MIALFKSVSTELFFKLFFNLTGLNFCLFDYTLNTKHQENRHIISNCIFMRINAENINFDT